MPGNDRHKIEDVKRNLYDVEGNLPKNPREGILHPVEHAVNTDWDIGIKKPLDDNLNYMIKKPPMSSSKKFFIVSVIFFLFASAFSAYKFFGNNSSVSNDNIDILVLGNAFTKGGEELPLQIEITNRNSGNLELSNLIISYPRGASDDANDIVRLPRESIGTIAPGQTITRNVRVTLFGDEKTTRDVKISLEYHPPGSNAIFSKDKIYTVTISSSPLSLLIDSQNEATANQDFSFKITASLNTKLPDNGTVLQVVYPSGFIFDSATPSPSIGNSIWSLSALSSTSPMVIEVKGRMVGQDGDQQVFHAYAGSVSPTNQSSVAVVYNSLLQSVTIVKPFLEAHVVVNGQDLSNYTASGGETVHVDVSWMNNLSTRVTDAQIIANISGNAFNKDSIDPMEGFYDSSNSRIIWDKNSVPDFASVEPGASGKVSFTLKPISLVGASVSVSSPQIVIDVSIKGRQPNLGTTFNDINNFSKKVIKILSDFQIASSASFTSGSLPPKADTETIYTVTWTLSNSANSISGAVARSTLPVYIGFLGRVSNNENLSYNEVTREVIWNIGSVSPNTGFGSSREVSFRLSLKPSLSQVDSVPQLMKDVFLSGNDSFSLVSVKSSYRPITTLLNNDSSSKAGNERVVR